MMPLTSCSTTRPKSWRVLNASWSSSVLRWICSSSSLSLAVKDFRNVSYSRFSARTCEPKALMISAISSIRPGRACSSMPDSICRRMRVVLFVSAGGSDSRSSNCISKTCVGGFFVVCSGSCWSAVFTVFSGSSTRETSVLSSLDCPDSLFLNKPKLKPLLFSGVLLMRH